MNEPLMPTLEPWLIPDSVANPVIETAKKKVATLAEVPKPDAAEEDSHRSGNDRLRDRYEGAFTKRLRDFKAVVNLAIERGVISQRGAHCYFKGKYLGNGDSFVWDLAESSYDLEAEIRMAVKETTGLPAPTLPGTLEEALANGWQHVGARGKSANFERRTARGFCQLVKTGIGGVLDVPFEATIKHGKPRRL